MRVYVYPADDFACGNLRLRWPAEAARFAGVDSEVVLPGSVTGIGAQLHPTTRAVVNVIYPADADVIVLQRPSNRLLVECIPLLRAKGVAVVVDMDDDLAHIHPANPAWRGLHPKANPDNNWQHIMAGCRAASLVTVSTVQLAAIYGGHGRVRIVPNCVPERFLAVDTARSGPTRFGWPGSLHSHPDDLRGVAGVIGQLIRDGHAFHQIGPDEGMAELLGTDEFTSSGLVPFEGWAEAVAGLDVGLAPLADTRFNQAKSALKPLEMSAVGVPWVASDVCEYRRFAMAAAGGVIAGRARDWLRELRRLLEQPELRAERAAAGREAVRAGWTIEANVARWVDAWADALALARPGSAPGPSGSGIVRSPAAVVPQST